MNPSTRVMRGSLTIVGWVVAVAWVAVAAFAWWRLQEPWGWVFAGVAVLAAALTGWVAWGLRVRVTDTGVASGGGREWAWEDIDHVGVRPGLISVPYLSVRVGRALDLVALDGLAGFRPGVVTEGAQEVADAGDLGDVVVAERRPSRSAGRRGIPG